MPKQQLALAALFAGAAAIGSSALFVRVSEAGPVSTAFWRVALALPVLWTWAGLSMRTRAVAHQPRPFLLLVYAGLFFAGDLALWHWSILLTSIANATLLANCAPLFVTLAAWVLYREHPGARFSLGLGASMSGVFLLFGGHVGESRPGALLGDALGVLTAVFYAGYQITVSRARREYSTASIMAWSGTVTALVLLPLAWFSNERFVPISADGWLTLLALALISQAAGQSLIAYALAHLPGTFASVGLLAQPVVASVLAWIVLGETLTVLAVAGGVLVLSGIRLARPQAQDTTPATSDEKYNHAGARRP